MPAAVHVDKRIGGLSVKKTSRNMVIFRRIYKRVVIGSQCEGISLQEMRFGIARRGALKGS